MTACIIGWAHTPFGRFENESVESLVVGAATVALDDAGVAAADVDEILLGHFNAGFRRRILRRRWCSRPRLTCGSNAPPGSRTHARPGPPPYIRGFGQSRPATPALCWWSGPSR